MDENGNPTAVIDGFTMGMFVSYGNAGEAWVQAPDGGIATLSWETGSPVMFEENIVPESAGRWGTYTVRLDLPLRTDPEADAYLRALLPDLTPRWQAWATARTGQPANHPAGTRAVPLSAPFYGAPFGEATKRFWKKYSNLTGRASRSEYWWCAFGFTLVAIALELLASAGETERASGGTAPLALLALLFQIILVVSTFIPSLTLTVRRLHDANISGWMIFVGLIPLVGWLALIIFALLPPRREGQAYDVPTY